MTGVEKRPGPEAALLGEVASVRASRGLLARFADAYQGRHHPEDALDWLLDDQRSSRRGTPAPAVDRSALYRPGTTPEARARILAALEALRLDRLQAEQALAATLAAASGTDDSAGRLAPGLQARRFPRRLALLIPAVGIAVAVVVAVQSHTRDGLTGQAVIDSRGAIAPSSYYRQHPALLPGGTGEHVVAEGRRLDGATAVTATSRATRLLLVVACSAADRSFEYTVRDSADRSRLGHGYGACGRMQLGQLRVPVGTRRLEVLVTTRGIDPFSLTIYSSV